MLPQTLSIVQYFADVRFALTTWLLHVRLGLSRYELRFKGVHCPNPCRKLFANPQFMQNACPQYSMISIIDLMIILIMCLTLGLRSVETVRSLKVTPAAVQYVFL